MAGLTIGNILLGGAVAAVAYVGYKVVKKQPIFGGEYGLMDQKGQPGKDLIAEAAWKLRGWKAKAMGMLPFRYGMAPV